MASYQRKSKKGTAYEEFDIFEVLPSTPAEPEKAEEVVEIPEQREELVAEPETVQPSQIDSKGLEVDIFIPRTNGQLLRSKKPLATPEDYKEKKLASNRDRMKRLARDKRRKTDNEAKTGRTKDSRVSQKEMVPLTDKVFEDAPDKAFVLRGLSEQIRELQAKEKEVSQERNAIILELEALRDKYGNADYSLETISKWTGVTKSRITTILRYEGVAGRRVFVADPVPEEE